MDLEQEIINPRKKLHNVSRLQVDYIQVDAVVLEFLLDEIETLWKETKDNGSIIQQC